tara:strand:- start:118 stop:285 length:168 start_codon:yes stop_codon:yes gene_type:complete
MAGMLLFSSSNVLAHSGSLHVHIVETFALALIFLASISIVLISKKTIDNISEDKK